MLVQDTTYNRISCSNLVLLVVASFLERRVRVPNTNVNPAPNTIKESERVINRVCISMIFLPEKCFEKLLI